MAAAAYRTEGPWSQDPRTGVCSDGVRYCGPSLGSTFLLENGASVDGAPVVLDSFTGCVFPRFQSDSDAC